MKLCPHCARKYPDETLNYCLDDGSELLFGPAQEPPTLLQERESDLGERETAILPEQTGDAKTTGPVTSGFLSGKRQLFAGVGIALLIGIIVAARYGFLTGERGGAEIRSIAVLPLENLSGDPSQEYFSDGMTDALIHDLSLIRSLKVTSRTSVMRFKGRRESLPDIARTLGVDAVVEGTVTRTGDRVRVTAQLIPAATDAAIWSRNYEREMSDLLRLQADVAQAIATEIKARITSTEQERLRAPKTIDPKASEEFLIANYHLQKLTDPDLELATSHFTRALEIEPEYAEAWAGLSRAWFERGIFGKYSHTDVESFARNAAQKALDLDPDLSSAHSAMSYINMNYDWDWAGAEEHAKRAIELDPSNSEAYSNYAWFLSIFGRTDELKPYMSTAEQLDPVSSNIQSDFGRLLYRARLFTDAETHLRKAIELNDSNYIAYGRLADVLSQTSRFEEALAVIEIAKTKNYRQSLDVRKAVILVRMGNRDAARQLFVSLKNRPHVDAALFHATLGELDKAFEELNLALDQRQLVLPQLRVDPSFDILHRDQRWAKFLARMNLPLG
jgi:TolB-like protein